MYKTKRTKKEKGQGLVEYALILVLVAIVVIAVLMLLGPIIGNVFSSINGSLSGVSGGGGGAPAAAPAGPIGSDHPSYTQFGGNYGPQNVAISAFCHDVGAPSGAGYILYHYEYYHYAGGAGTSEKYPGSTVVGTGTCP